MLRMAGPAVGGRAGWMALGLVAAMLPATATYAQQPPAAPAQQAQQVSAARLFPNDAGMVLNFIKPDKVADFEMIIGKLKEALMKSDKPERKQQAESWTVYKAAEAGAGGAAIYVSVISPAVKGADYTVSTILAEAFPQEANELYKKYAEAFGTPSGNLLNLTLIGNLAK